MYEFCFSISILQIRHHHLLGRRDQSTESPILDAHFGSENGVSTLPLRIPENQHIASSALIHRMPENQHIASSPHRLIASSPHRLIASSPHRIIASSHHRLIASSPHRMRISFVSSCKLVTKEHRIPENQHISSSRATLFCIILQTCYKRASHPRKPTHDLHISSSHATLFCIILQTCYKRASHPRKPTHDLHIASSHATLFCIILQTCYKRASHHRVRLSFVSSCKLVTKEHRLIACDSLLYHLANLLQKSLACAKTNTSPHRMRLSFVSSCKLVTNEHRIIACDSLLYHLANSIHNPSNGRFPKFTIRMRTFFLRIVGGHSSVLDGL
jgi:hypothetical protein